MALRKPLVLINGGITTLPAADSIATSNVVGVKYHFINEVVSVAQYYQYHVVGKIILEGTSILRLSGNGVIT